jgi:hypothetical protein
VKLIQTYLSLRYLLSVTLVRGTNENVSSRAYNMHSNISFPGVYNMDRRSSPNLSVLLSVEEESAS